MTADPCEEVHLLVQAELDGELDAAGAASLARHLESCAGCAALRGELQQLSARMRGGLTRHAAPPALRRSVLAQLPRVARRPAWRLSWGHGVSFGAGMALAAGLAMVVVLPQRGGPLDDIVAAHIRALQPGHLVDVDSTDQHTVKPWFDGKLDYAPPVRDFGAQGFPLVGGRLDYLNGRPVAALVYRRGKHLIDLFVWPGDRVAAGGAVQGYTVDAWDQDGMIFRAVSDVSPTDLATFVELWKKADPSTVRD